jgi:hypothetical protein
MSFVDLSEASQTRGADKVQTAVADGFWQRGRRGGVHRMQLQIDIRFHNCAVADEPALSTQIGISVTRDDFTFCGCMLGDCDGRTASIVFPVSLHPLAH